MFGTSTMWVRCALCGAILAGLVAGCGGNPELAAKEEQKKQEVMLKNYGDYMKQQHKSGRPKR